MTKRPKVSVEHNVSQGGQAQNEIIQGRNQDASRQDHTHKETDIPTLDITPQKESLLQELIHLLDLVDFNNDISSLTVQSSVKDTRAIRNLIESSSTPAQRSLSSAQQKKPHLTTKQP